MASHDVLPKSKFYTEKKLKRFDEFMDEFSRPPMATIKYQMIPKIKYR